MAQTIIAPGRTVKLPVHSDEWMFGVTQATVTSVRPMGDKTWVFVKIPGRSRRSAFLLTEIKEAQRSSGASVVILVRYADDIVVGYGTY